MSEIKASIDGMTDEERFFAAAYIQHRARERDTAYRALLAERMGRMGDVCAIGQLGDITSAQRVLTDHTLRTDEANEYCGVFNPCTIYSVVFAPVRKELWVRVADQPDRTFERLCFD